MNNNLNDISIIINSKHESDIYKLFINALLFLPKSIPIYVISKTKYPYLNQYRKNIYYPPTISELNNTRVYYHNTILTNPLCHSHLTKLGKLVSKNKPPVAAITSPTPIHLKSINPIFHPKARLIPRPKPKSIKHHNVNIVDNINISRPPTININLDIYFTIQLHTSNVKSFRLIMKYLKLQTFINFEIIAISSKSFILNYKMSHKNISYIYSISSNNNSPIKGKYIIELNDDIDKNILSDIRLLEKIYDNINSNTHNKIWNFTIYENQHHPQ